MVLDPSHDHPSAPGGPSSGESGSAPEWPEPDALQPGPQFRSLLAMVDAVEVTVADALAHLAEQAVAALPVADGACVAFGTSVGRRVRAATADVAAELQDLQEDLGEGPGIEAAARRRPVLSGDLEADPRWPRLTASLGDTLVRSVLVLPLLGPSGVLGTLTLYASAASAFDDRSAQLGVRLAASAARTVRHALVLERARRLTTHRHLRRRDQATVDRAILVLMQENGVGSEEAYGVLQLLGRTEQEDLVAVARAIVAAEDAQRAGVAAPEDDPPALRPRG
ncbi:GAF domain-containing protein [uncultured Friedmanniella sp.]|uniref:GAF domain-containing protein n=1 Tax=uncultured Friedmanniella sp. TaxID=335381 RepID=UPI0035C981E3